MKQSRKTGPSAPTLSFEEIRRLAELVTENGLSSLEVEQPGLRIRIEGAHRPPGTGASSPENLHDVLAPIAGTFYAAPSPEAGAFVEVGQRVTRGKILCVIESLQLMNEIEADVEGEVVNVYPRSGLRVEQGERLFAIRLAGSGPA